MKILGPWRRPRHRTVLPGSNLSEAAIGVAIRGCPGVQPRRSHSRLHAIIADSASFANSADRFANNFASDTASDTSASAHASKFLRLLPGQPRLRPAADPRLPWASRSQAHRSLHTRRSRTLRGTLALSPGVFALKATKRLPFWSVGHF